jgi:alpha-glucosidase
MRAAVQFWMDLGVDGIRVDAVNWLGKDRQFRDNPRNAAYVAGVDDPFHEFERKYSQGMPQLYDYLRELAEVVQAYPNGFIVTETYPYGAKDIVGEYVELYRNYVAEVMAPFNFHAMRLPWSAVGFKTFVDAFEAAIDPKHVPVYVMGNHDTSRLATRIGAEAARTAAVMLLTLPGVSFVYYGDEVGMADVPIPADRVQDPFEKRVPGMGLGRDPERTPMQWNGEPQAGFSTAEPWLPVAADYMQRNVAAESADAGSFLSLYRRLGQLRNTMPVLQRGLYRPLDAGNAQVYGYVRELVGGPAEPDGDKAAGNASVGPKRVVVLLNFAETEQTAQTGLGRGRLLVNARLDRPEGEVVDLGTAVLAPHDGLVVQLD